MLVLQSQIEHLRIAGFDEGFGVVTVPRRLLSKQLLRLRPWKTKQHQVVVAVLVRAHVGRKVLCYFVVERLVGAAFEIVQGTALKDVCIAVAVSSVLKRWVQEDMVDNCTQKSTRSVCMKAVHQGRLPDVHSCSVCLDAVEGKPARLPRMRS